jgi:hypothetical protein
LKTVNIPGDFASFAFVNQHNRRLFFERQTDDRRLTNVEQRFKQFVAFFRSHATLPHRPGIFHSQLAHHLQAPANRRIILQYH